VVVDQTKEQLLGEFEFNKKWLAGEVSGGDDG